MKVYYTYYDGGKPYCIGLEKDTINIYKEIGKYSNKYEKEPFLTFKNVEKTFVGKSPKNSLTSYSGAYGKKYDGNSILINLKDNTYLYIGLSIFKFRASSKIKKFVSPVSTIPYSYAIDEENKYYLMNENIIINKLPKNKQPYNYYYDFADNVKMNQKKTLSKKLLESNGFSCFKYFKLLKSRKYY